MSLETPDMHPSQAPLLLFSISSICAIESFCVRSRNPSTPGSTSPQRVPNDQALGRREPHRGIYGAAVVHSAERGAVSEMAAYQPKLVGATLQEVRRAQRDIVVGRAVEAVASDGVLLVELVRQSVEVRVGGQGVVERRVEDRDLGDGREEPAHLADARHHHRVMERGEGVHRLDLREHLIGDERSFGKLLAAVNDAMDDDALLAGAADHAGPLGGQLGGHGLERLGETDLGQVAGHRVARPAMHKPRAVDADALDEPAPAPALVDRVEKAVFEGGGAAVDDEDLFRTFTLERESVGVVALAKCRGGLRRIGQDRLHPLGNDPRDVPHCARFGDNDGLEERHRDEQHLAVRFGDEVRDRLFARHQGHFAECVAGLEMPQHLGNTAIVRDRCGHRSA